MKAKNEKEDNETDKNDKDDNNTDDKDNSNTQDDKIDDNEKDNNETNNDKNSSILPSKVSSSLSTIMDYLSSKIADRVSIDMGNSEIQNGFKAVSKASSNLNLQ